MKAMETTRLTQHRGSPRLWLQGHKPSRSGFAPGKRFCVRKDPEHNRLILELSDHGNRLVSRKVDGERFIPVIDINSAADLAHLEGFDTLRVICQDMRIVILPTAVAIAKKERMERLRAKIASAAAISVGSISHGAGVLSHALHAGMKSAGLNPKLVFANEIRSELLEHASVYNDAWNEGTTPIATPLQELAFDTWAVDHLPKVEVLEAGLPCSGASRAGRAKNGAGHAEAHPEVGHLVVGFLVVIAKVQPAVVVLENVRPYQTSASMHILRNQLRDFGYQVHETVLDSSDWNVLERRERLCMVAVTEGLEFDFALLRRPVKVERTLGEVLEDIPVDDPRWSPMAGLKLKEERDREKGSNFKMQIVDSQSDFCPTITKGYSRVRSTDPKVRNPQDPNLLRQLTLLEHSRMKGIPSRMIGNAGVTFGHEFMGQSVCYEPFVAVGELIGNAVKSVNRPTRPNLARVLTTALPASQPQQLALLAA